MIDPCPNELHILAKVWIFSMSVFHIFIRAIFNNSFEILGDRLSGAPSLSTCPRFRTTHPIRQCSIAAMLWLTNSTVRPSLATSLILPRHFFWNCRVADRQHFVHDQDFRLQVGGHGEGQPHVHAAASSA